MKTYNIKGLSFEFDETLEYLEFYLVRGKPNLVKIQFELFFDGVVPTYEREPSEALLNEIKEFVQPLARWVIEAPRKRFYRDMIRSGFQVLSAEYFFEADSGEKVIDGLENTGKVAAAILNTYGLPQPDPIVNDDPINPVSMD